MPEVGRRGPMTPATLLRLSLRLLVRDWRGGELRLLLLALIMAVTSVSGIGLFTDRLQQALVRESATMLAADRVLSGREQAPDAWIEEARARGLETARFVAFSSMAFSERGNLLVAAKAVSEDYPLRGRLWVAEQAFVDDGAPVSGGPRPGTVWVESRVLPALDMDVGDELELGEAQFTVSRVITREPDRQQGRILDNAGPRVMLSLQDLEATNVVQPGSRVSYRYLFAGDEPTLGEFSQWLEARAGERFRVSDIREESQEVAEALERAESFLMLGGLFAVLLAGLAIALTARRYSERHFDYVAILKTLGCTAVNIAALYSLIMAVLLVVAVAIGSLLGWAVHEGILALLGTAIPVSLPAGSVTPFLIAAATALLCLLAFALPPLLALKRTSPLRVLRRDLDSPDVAAWLPYLLGAGGALALVFWYAGDWLLALILVSSVAGVAATVTLVSWLLLRSGAALGTRAGSAWRLAMSAARRRRQSVLQVMVFALTLMSLLTLVLLRTDLIDDWRQQLPEDVPNHFMMNIGADEVDGIRRFFRENGVEPNPFYPMVTAGLMAINGETERDREEDEEVGQAANIAERGAEQAQARQRPGSADPDGPGADEPERMSTRQITWTTRLPPDNEVVAGQWWGRSAQSGQVSVEEDFAEWYDIELGDELAFETDDRRFSATVANLRSVRWDNMQPNFYFIFSPGTVPSTGATWLSTITLEGEQQRLLSPLLEQYPTIVVIEVDALIEQVRTIVAQVTSAIELIALLVLASGALVLLACINASVDERFRENAVLRALGAGRRLILSSLLIEFAFIGLVAGIVATIGAEITLHYLQREIFLQEFSAHYWMWIAGPVSGTVIIAVLGIMATRRVVSTSPLAVLRDID